MSRDTLLFLLLTIAVDSARGTCVFNSEFGFNLTCGFRKTSLFRVRNLGGVKGYVGLGFSVGDELGFNQALSTTEDQDKRRSASDNDVLRTAAMSTGRSHSGRSPQMPWDGLTGLPGTAGAVPGSPGVVPPFKPLANSKEAAVPPFSALPPSIARIPVINGRPQAAVQPPAIFQASLQQMANRRFQQVAPSMNDAPAKNSIVVGSVEKLPSPLQVQAPSRPMAVVFSPPSKPRESVASKTKRLQDVLHHPDNQLDTASPSPLLMGHSIQSLSKASNISAEVIAAALRLREQQLIASLTSTAAPTTTTTTTTSTTPRPTKPATVRPKYPLIGPNRVMNAPKEYYPVSYDQNYDDNFTSKVELPDTTFSCGDQKHFPGLYADEDLGCMVFHVCAFTDDGMVMKSFLCPESTLFDQSILKCNWWFYVDCKASKRLYDSNIPISKSYQLMKALAFFSAYKNQTSNNT